MTADDGTGREHVDDRRARARKAVGRSLGVKLLIYLLIFVVLFAVVVAELLQLGSSGVLPALAGLLGGLLVGLVASRMFRIRWDEVSGTVASALDAVGVAILVGYVLFSLNRGRIAEIWFDGPVVGVVSLAALAGAMGGQLLGTRAGVVRALRASGLFGRPADDR